MRLETVRLVKTVAYPERTVSVHRRCLPALSRHRNRELVIGAGVASSRVELENRIGKAALLGPYSASGIAASST
ncbi:hypothetical protein CHINAEXTREME_08895 [Halobiforma lacisalsi AJ5]|uniref:Uncharacterized protein n=1 Tax=Natronobacterium lacisalsi AJ5 TaxID=358396 RepID=A0A1P8LQ20_NATLA|nr:hypothetical protein CHINAEXTREME_08895 [Halobiforma lacisalsi AJ5]